MTSILKTIKKLLGIPDEQTNFDVDLIVHINSVLMTLNQLGVGPEEGFIIADEFANWDDFIPEDDRLQMIKSYMYLRVRLLFDPPLSSSVLAAMERTISEFEWRLNVKAESK